MIYGVQGGSLQLRGRWRCTGALLKVRVVQKSRRRRVRGEPGSPGAAAGPGWVILQAPLYLYEGDDIWLRCYSPYDRLATQTILYRNNQTIQKLTTNYNLQQRINYTDLTATYRCSKQFLTTIANTYSDETTISYTEIAGTIPVTFNPNWNKLFTGDGITMTCLGGGDLTYQWLQNGKMVAEGRIYTITSAQVGHSGDYQCQTNHGNSLTFRLDVSDGPLILQAPIFVYQGNNINLNCHSRPEYSVHRTAYYKNNDVILGPSSNLYSALIYGNVDVSGRYRCERGLSRGEYVMYTDEGSLHVRDLFFKPDITTLLYPMTEGDNMTLTCDTSLSPLRQGTELQFSFYRDGEEIQKYSSSHQYNVYSAQIKDSGNYSCKVRTPTNSVMKISEELYIQIQGRNPGNSPLTMNMYLIILFILLFLLTIAVIVAVVIKCRRKPSLTSTNRRSTMEPEAESQGDLSQEGDVCYAKINLKQKEPATSSNADEDLCYANLKISQKASSPRATENQVVYSEIRAKKKT